MQGVQIRRDCDGSRIELLVLVTVLRRIMSAHTCINWKKGFVEPRKHEIIEGRVRKSLIVQSTVGYINRDVKSEVSKGNIFLNEGRLRDLVSTRKIVELKIPDCKCY